MSWNDAAFDRWLTETKPKGEAIKKSREYHVRSTYTGGMANYLLNGDGFRIDKSAPLGERWLGIMNELVELGYMRQSRTGRFWWRES